MGKEGQVFAIKCAVAFVVAAPLLQMLLHFYATVILGKTYDLNEKILYTCLGSLGIIIAFFFKKVSEKKE